MKLDKGYVVMMKEEGYDNYLSIDWCLLHIRILLVSDKVKKSNSTIYKPPSNSSFDHILYMHKLYVLHISQYASQSDRQSVVQSQTTCVYLCTATVILTSCQMLYLLIDIIIVEYKMSTLNRAHRAQGALPSRGQGHKYLDREYVGAAAL